MGAGSTSNGGGAGGAPGRVPRGLAALIPTSPKPPNDTESPTIGRDGSRLTVSTRTGPAQALQAPDIELISIEPHRVAPNPRQPRQEFDPQTLEELARSLLEVGMLQPIVVRRPEGRRRGRGGAAGAGRCDYELVAGERRLRAARLAGLETVPALVRGTADDELLRSALLENLQRVQLNPLEEAAAYDQLLVDFGGTHDELAAKLGRSRPQISNTLRLLRLPVPVQRRVASGILSAGHARALVGMTDLDAMDRLAKRIVAEGLSVRAVEEIVSVGTVERGRRATGKLTGRPLPELDELGARLSDRLDTRVSVQMGRRRGRVTIEFSGVEDLHRIANLLGDQPES